MLYFVVIWWLGMSTEYGHFQWALWSVVVDVVILKEATPIRIDIFHYDTGDHSEEPIYSD